jgi:pyruvate dehydrogenase E1 component alpha subunit
MGTALARSESQIELTRKAASYGLPTAHINGMNVLAVHEAAKDAFAQVRATQAPFFLELHTYRFRAHSMFDAELYREKSEVARWKDHGPIHTFTERLKAAGMMTEDDFLAIDREAMAEVDAAVRFAEAGTWEPVEQLTRDVCTPTPG